MPSSDDRPTGLLSGWAQANRLEPVSGPLPGGEPASSTTPVQVPNTQTPSTGQLAPLAPAITRQLPAVTRTLPSISESTSQRIPVVIKGELKKIPAPAPLPPPIHKKRRQRSSLLGIALLLLILVLALLSASPLGHDIGLNFNALQQGSSLVNNPRDTLNSLVAQATATAVFHKQNDGYDPFYTTGQVITKGLTSLNWPTGECTYWANLRYQQITGNWVAWSGNADQWVDGARKAGWNISSTPHAPSIIVLMPGTQGASRAYGHVAVVESVDGNTAHTSNMNWYANGGGFDRTSNVDFTAGPGVYFIWHQ